MQISGGRDIAHQPPLVPKNWNDNPFMWYQNIGRMFYSFVPYHACDGRTDRRMDRQIAGQNYDPQDRASIAASRGKISNYSCHYEPLIHIIMNNE